LCFGIRKNPVHCDCAATISSRIPEGSTSFEISKKKVYGPIFFAEPTVTGMIYLDMLENWLMPQLNEDSNDYLFQQDGCPAHYHKDG
jgi:hypothetical protein